MKWLPCCLCVLVVPCLVPTTTGSAQSVPAAAVDSAAFRERHALQVFLGIVQRTIESAAEARAGGCAAWPRRPDLAIQHIGWELDPAGPHVDFANTGQVLVNLYRPWTSRIYFSSDRVLDPGDGLMCEYRGTPELYPNEHAGLICLPTLSLTPIPPGNWYFIAQLEVGDEIAELDETNNMAATDTTVYW
jgi:hypothetical protein